MLRTMMFAAVAGMTLVSASPYHPAPPQERAGAYPACSGGVQDRCIQLYERGVSREDNLALNDDLGSERGAAPENRYAEGPSGGDESTAIMASEDSTADYPPCSGSVTDRCVQRGGSMRSHATQMAGTRHERREMQLAMAAGERG